jgi:hypothetical protein
MTRARTKEAVRKFMWREQKNEQKSAVKNNLQNKTRRM